jgi:hypothetical protein
MDGSDLVVLGRHHLVLKFAGVSSDCLSMGKARVSCLKPTMFRRF